jgi:FixJ family two-component response regulator
MTMMSKAPKTGYMNFPLEAVRPDPRTDRSAENPAPMNFLGTRLLIVDDELPYRKVLALMVEQAGMTCKTVPSATEALNLLESEPVDAVIADLNMPGVSGLELLTEIRRRYPNLVFLMATGVDDVRLGVYAMRQGADNYLVKPLQTEAVMLSLDRAFHKKSLERELENYRQNLEQMVCKRTVELQNALGQVEQSYADTLDALGAAIDLRDGQTAGHSRRVVLWSLQILMRMQGTQGLHVRARKQLRRARLPSVQEACPNRDRQFKSCRRNHPYFLARKGLLEKGKPFAFGLTTQRSAAEANGLFSRQTESPLGNCSILRASESRTYRDYCKNSQRRPQEVESVEQVEIVETVKMV